VDGSGAAPTRDDGAVAARADFIRARYQALSHEWAVTVAADGTVIDANHFWWDILGWDEDEVIGRPFRTLLRPADEAVWTEAVEGVRRGRRTQAVDLQLPTKYGLIRSIAARLSRDPDTGWCFAVGSDTTRHVGQRNRLASLAERDLLTGLANRRRLEAVTAELLPTSACALLYIDLDDFKPVNDELGHSAGDTVLARFAQRLEARAGADDLVVRLGGDEFVVIVWGRPPWSTIQRLARGIIDVASEPLPVDGETVYVGASVGICLGEPGYRLDTLLALAAQALYVAKAAGGRRWHLADRRATTRLGTPSRRPSAYIIDDDTDARTLIVASLAPLSADVVGMAATVREAVSEWADVQPDIVICDINLPDGSGIDVAHQILSAKPDVHVVLISANVTEAARADARELGVTVVEKEHLVSTLGTVLSGAA
jgi:diguanylate cyclase (GGDEF)-like protein/PAS domain S-box-containing protein